MTSHSKQILKLIEDREEFKIRQHNLVIHRALAQQAVMVAVLDKKYARQWRDLDMSAVGNNIPFWLFAFQWEIVSYDEYRITFRSLKQGAASITPKGEFAVPWKYFRVSNWEFAKFVRSLITLGKQNKKDAAWASAERKLEEALTQRGRNNLEIEKLAKMVAEKKSLATKARGEKAKDSRPRKATEKTPA